MPPLARLKGLEPLAHCLEGSCSIHLSYRRVSKENKGQENGAGQTSPERGPRKAVLQTLWGEEGQGGTDFAQMGPPQSRPSGFVGKGGAKKWSTGCPQGVPRGMDFAPTLERVMGIEPTRPAWKAGILPLNYTRKRMPPQMSAWI